MKWIFPLSLLIVFEIIADILAKQYSLNHKMLFAILALLGYVTANTFWLFALRNGSGLARGAVIFSVATGIIAVVIGVGLYHETVSRQQIIGLVLGILSIGILSVG